jgi:hypothetical protein
MFSKITIPARKACYNYLCNTGHVLQSTNIKKGVHKADLKMRIPLALTFPAFFI